MCSMLAVTATVQCNVKVGCRVSSRQEGDHSPPLTYPSAVTVIMIDGVSRIPLLMPVQVILLLVRIFRVIECHIGYILTVQV
mmetsp:Transcript_39870/g.102733  ORF Transcript_39870/g.102733 Transcript_39870/m.102733 type:complete len:82 (-) Transcript_39870:318-563(-)